MCNHCEEINWKNGKRRVSTMTAEERKKRDVIDAGAEKLKHMMIKALERHHLKPDKDNNREMALVEQDARNCANQQRLVEAQSNLWYAEIKIAHPEVNEWHGMHIEDNDATLYEILPGECKSEPSEEEEESLRTSVGHALDALIKREKGETKLVN